MDTQNFQKYISSLKLIHIALLLGQLCFAAIAFYLNTNGGISDSNSSKIVQFSLILFFSLQGIVAGHLLFKNRLKKIRGEQSLTTKLTAYRTLVIIRFALAEAPSVFSIMAYLLTQEKIFLGLFGLIVAYFFYLKPSKEKFFTDLELSGSDKLKLENPNINIFE